MNLKPMLAGKAPENLDLLPYPVITSPKLDGIRCLISNGVALSRSLKPIPNVSVQEWAQAHPELHGLDGELIVGDPTDPGCIRASMSALMSSGGSPDFHFYAFDRWDRGAKPFSEFLSSANNPAPRTTQLWQHTTPDTTSLLRFEEQVLELGYEGLILRSPHSPYKFGRSTTREAYLLKLKRFQQAEAVIVGVEELLHNYNEPQINALGLTERSSHQANKGASGLLGALIVEMDGVQFNIGTGFTHHDRVTLWPLRETLVGQLVSFKYFPVGVKERPRHPVFICFRNPLDRPTNLFRLDGTNY